MSPHAVCSRCIYDSTLANISFDASGVCNYCQQVDELKLMYGTGAPEGERRLHNILDAVKAAGHRRKYDCVVGLSGGTDSSFLLMRARDWGLRPLAVHYDNTWNTAICSQNIRKVTQALKVDLDTYVVSNREADAIYRAFIRSGVLEWDASTDIAFVQVLRSAAARHGVRYILEGHSFVAEGVSPAGNNYFDGRYVKSVYERFGDSGPLKTYPNLTFSRFLKWALVYQQSFIRPLWYIDYSKEAAKRELQSRTGWEDYGGHHLENRAAVFGHTVWLPQRYGLDFRNLSLAARVRAGLMTREAALEEYARPVTPDPEIVSYVRKRLGLSDDEYQRLMTAPKRNFREFKTYKRRFELLRPLFYVLARANRVPMSFYLKYCFPLKETS